MDRGNQEVKRKGLAEFEKGPDRWPSEYRTAFWHQIHKKTKTIFLPDCTRQEAVDTLLEISGELIQGVKEGKCEFKDLHYAEEIFNKMNFIYDANALYDLHGGEFYQLIEYMDNHDNIEDIEKEYGTFMTRHKGHE